MEQYAIVEFDDGLQMIPSFWITENKKQAHWPTFTSNERFSKAVQKCMPKMDSWPLYEIKRILATANTYEKGMTKLKKAEFISDLNSESDEISKKNRKYRAKTVLTSEESSSEEENIVHVPSYPKLPSSKVQKKNNNMQSNENPVNKIFKSKGVLKQIENENVSLPTTTPSKKTSVETNIHLKETSIERYDSINNTEHDLNHNIKKTHNPEAFKTDSSVNTSITQFERYIIRKLLDIEYKVSSIQEHQRNINTKIDYIQNQMQTFGLDDNKTKKKDVESDYMELFPVETLEKLQELEQLLINNKINRKTLMKQLARIGGTDIKSITFNILRRIMSDSVGSMFSYVGGKKKYPFFDLYLRKIIFGAVRIYFPEATEQNISEPIKSWLRHANERNIKKNLNKSKKSLMQEDENQSNMEQYADRRPQKENMDKRAESVVQEDNQEADDDDDGDETTLDDLIGPNLF